MNKQLLRERLKIVAILRGFSPPQALAAAKVFEQCGIRAVEVTFNTDNAAAIIETLVSELGEEMIIGAGTVMTPAQVRAAKEAGASFILSPHTDPDVIEETKRQGLFSVPGAFTATEVVLAVKHGADMVKIFPAGRLGADYIKDLRGPLDKIPMMAVGAVNLANCRSFLAAGAESVGLGSCLADKKLIEGDQFQELAVLAHSFLAEVEGAGRVA